MGGGSIFREKGHAFHRSFKRISDLSPRRKGASGLCAEVQVLCGSRTISFRLGPALPAQFSVFPLQLGASQTGWSQDQPEALGPSPGDSDSEGPSGGIGVGVEGAPQESASNERGPLMAKCRARISHGNLHPPPPTNSSLSLSVQFKHRHLRRSLQFFLCL